jgi:predicted helicase
MTQLGANVVYPDYGSALPGIPGKRNNPGTLDLIRDGVIRAVSFVKEMETSTDTAEIIDQIVSLSVAETADKQGYIIRLKVQMQDGQYIETSTP